MDFTEDYELHEVGLILAFAIFLVLNVLDALSTFVGLVYHHFIELNPLGAYMISRIGVLDAMIVLKSLFLGIIGGTIYFVLRDTPDSFLDDDALLAGLALLNIVGFFVLSNNFGLLGWPYFFHFRFSSFFFLSF